MPRRSLNCRDVVATLDDYVDERMSARRRDAVEAHLSGCEKCSAYLRSYRETVRAARNAFTTTDRAESVPEELVKSVLHERRGR